MQQESIQTAASIQTTIFFTFFSFRAEKGLSVFRSPQKKAGILPIHFSPRENKSFRRTAGCDKKQVERDHDGEAQATILDTTAACINN